MGKDRQIYADLDDEALVFAYIFFCKQGSGKEEMLEEIVRRGLLVKAQKCFSYITGYGVDVIHDQLKEEEKGETNRH